MDLSVKAESLAGKFNIRWLQRYLKFIELFKKDKSIKNKTHNHHILPRSLFPEYKNLGIHKWNKAILTYREHYIAHYLLAKALGGNMWFAFNQMNIFNNKFSGILYANAMTEHSKLITGSGNPMFGKKHSQETKDKISLSNLGKKYSDESKQKISKVLTGKKHSDEVNKKKGRKGELNHNFGKKHSEEAKIKMSKAKENFIPWNLGKNHSEETKLKIKNAAQNRSLETNKKISESLKRPENYLTCVYCNKTMIKSAYTRWHGEKCKQGVKDGFDR